MSSFASRNWSNLPLLIHHLASLDTPSFSVSLEVQPTIDKELNDNNTPTSEEFQSCSSTLVKGDCLHRKAENILKIIGLLPPSILGVCKQRRASGLAPYLATGWSKFDFSRICTELSLSVSPLRIWSHRRNINDDIYHCLACEEVNKDIPALRSNCCLGSPFL